MGQKLPNCDLFGSGQIGNEFRDIVIEREGSREPTATNDPNEAERNKTAQGQD